MKTVRFALIDAMKLLGSRVLRAGVLLLAWAGMAQAHPHVSVTVKATVIASPEGRITAIRHAWTFDEPFSAYSTMGMDTNKDGKLSREELADLAKVNVESLNEYAFFTRLLQGKVGANFSEPVNYFLDHDGKALTLHFTLPVKDGAMLLKDAKLEVADPSFFVSFEFAKANPVAIEGFSGQCTAQLKPPSPSVFKRLSQLGESAFEQGTGLGADFATPVSFLCK